MDRCVKFRRSRRAARPGGAAVELAVLLPFLALMFSAAVDFGRIFNATQTLDRATNTAAVYASGAAWVPTLQTTATEAAVTAACSEGASLNPPLASGNITITSSGSSVTVVIVYDYPLLTAVLVPSASVQLQRTVTLPVAPTPGS